MQQCPLQYMISVYCFIVQFLEKYMSVDKIKEIDIYY